MKKHRTFSFLLALAGFAMLPATAAATDVVIEGAVSYSASGSTVTIEVDQVTNYSSDTTSGTLFLTLWATGSSSPSGSGYELAQVSLGELAPNEYFYNIVQTTSFTAPPDGTYYIHLLLSEYPNLSSYIDYITFGQETFGGGSDGGDAGGGGGGGSDDGTCGDALEICGSVLPIYDGEGFIAEIQFSGVSTNSGTVAIINGKSSTSGNLVIRMVASESPYDGGTLSGYTMAEYDSLSSLPSNNFYSDFTAFVSPSSTHPEYGDYYTYVLLLEQSSDGEYYIVDWRGSTSTKTTVGCGSDSSCLNSGSGGDSGDSSGGDDSGGGAAHPFLILLGLLGALAVRRRRT